MKVLYFIILLLNFTAFSQEWRSVIVSSATDHNEGVCVKLHNDKSYFSGNFKGSISIDGQILSGIAYDDIFLGRADLDGNLDWLISIKGTEIDKSTALLVVEDQILLAGNYSDSLFIGSDTLVNQYQRATFLAYFDTLGNYIRTVDFDGYNAQINDLQIDHEGNIVMTGNFFQFFNYGSFTMNAVTGFSFFALKYNPVQDEIVWNANATDGTSDGQRIAIGDDNSIYAVGQFNDGTNMMDTVLHTDNINHNLFLLKLSELGAKQWLRTAEGIFEVHGYGVAVGTDAVYMTGEFEDEISIGSTTLTSEGFYDVLVAKYTNDGTLVWAKSVGGSQSDEGYDIALNSSGNPIVMIEAGIGILFDGQPLSVNGWNEPMLLKLDQQDGSLIWSKSLQSKTTSGLVEVRDMDFENGVISITGVNRTSIIWGNGELIAANTKDFYAAILNEMNSNASIDEYIAFDIEIFPNPNNGSMKVLSKDIIELIEIHTSQGQLVEQLVPEGVNCTIHLLNVNPGLYYVNIQTKRSNQTKKLIIN